MYGLSGPIAISGLGQSEAGENSELPTRAEVKANVQHWLELAPREFPGDMSSEAAVDWGMEALNSYAESKGVSRSNAHHVATRDYVASANRGRGFNPYDPRYGEYAQALGEMAGAKGSEYYGAAVQLGVVTYETVRDGHFSERDAEQLGQVTGAVVGAVVGQAFGVPAPIGAFAGGLVGGGTARMTYHVFAGPDLQKIAKEQERKARKEMELWRRDAVTTCRGLQTVYWREVDRFYDSFSRAWFDSETNIGWRFGLRWFDPNPELAFQFQWDKDKLAVTDTKLSDPHAVEYGCRTEAVVHSGGRELVQMHCKRRCKYVWGCPYPELGGLSAKVSKEDPITTPRVAEAFAARGVLWVPPQSRINCDTWIERVPSGNLAANYQEKIQYKARVNGQLDSIEADLWRLSRAKVVLGTDLLRTVVVVASERDLYVNHASYITDGWQRGAYDKIIKRSQQLSSALNWGMFAGGAALLGYGLWRAVK